MLRPAIAEDALAVAQVLIESRKAFLPFAPSVHAEEDILDWVASRLIPTGGVTVAVVEKKAVAVLATTEDETVAWINQLYVLPGFEGQGFGSKLLSHAHVSLKRPIRLYTFQQNVAAIRFYEQHGYEPVEFTDGSMNEEKCPDILYEFQGKTTEA
jgi:ribosomal protein S18 acetylase RimI-like enzyme